MSKSPASPVNQVIDSPFGAAFLREIAAPFTTSLGIARQWHISPNVLYGDNPINRSYQLRQTVGATITQNTFQNKPDSSKTNNHNFVQSSQLQINQAMYLKLMGGRLLGAP